jgi:acetoin utilization deacetylase AcuC-like enzyme
VATIGFCSSARFIEHTTGPHHPERPDRIRAVHRAVRAAGMIDSPDPFPQFQLDLGAVEGRGIKLIELAPRSAEHEWPLLVHPLEYVDRIEHICKLGGGVLDLGDTPVGRESFEIALLSLGSLLTCCDAVMAGEVDRAFSAGRPPGHHAEPDRAMGFCLFSNIAIAARYLQRRHGLQRIAIVDFDVHHGNGTQACFESDPSVLFISLHQHPRTCYPGSGHEWETGVGDGEGFTVNIPFAPGAGDEQYLAAFDQKVIPRLDDFKPQALLVSAGFDAHAEDSLAQINLSEECFQQMTSLLTQSAQTHCGGRVISALEGGYNLRALGRSVVRHLRGLDA